MSASTNFWPSRRIQGQFIDLPRENRKNWQTSDSCNWYQRKIHADLKCKDMSNEAVV